MGKIDKVDLVEQKLFSFEQYQREQNEESKAERREIKESLECLNHKLFHNGINGEIKSLHFKVKAIGIVLGGMAGVASFFMKDIYKRVVDILVG